MSMSMAGSNLVLAEFQKISRSQIDECRWKGKEHQAEKTVCSKTLHPEGNLKLGDI